MAQSVGFAEYVYLSLCEFQLKRLKRNSGHITAVDCFVSIQYYVFAILPFSTLSPRMVIAGKEAPMTLWILSALVLETLAIGSAFARLLSAHNVDAGNANTQQP